MGEFLSIYQVLIKNPPLFLELGEKEGEIGRYFFMYYKKQRGELGQNEGEIGLKINMSQQKKRVKWESF